MLMAVNLIYVFKFFLSRKMRYMMKMDEMPFIKKDN